jgi:hypothetical protein
MSTIEKVIDEAICGADIEVGRLRDEYENVLEEYFKLHDKVLTDEETIRFNELELQRKRIEDYISGIQEEYASILSRMMKNKK